MQLALAALLVGLVVGFLHFGEAGDAPFDDGPLPATAIVFTGADERVEAAIALLAEGKVARLFISGANPASGLRIESFQATFATGYANLPDLLACCIAFGERAGTTLENALESRCWLEEEAIAGPLALVTSADHMPRALLALGHISRRPISLCL